MLSMLGWLDGLSGAMVMIAGIVFGTISFRKGKKMEAKLLSYAGIMMIFMGLLYLGPVTDFITILITGTNMNNDIGQYGMISYMWVGLAMPIAMYIGATLMIPEKKVVIVYSFATLGVVFELFLFLNTMQSFIFTFPAVPGENLIDSRFVTLSAAFIFIALFLLCVLLFNGIGFMRKAIQSTGEIKKKFLYLSLGFILFVLAGAMDSFSGGVMLPIIRLGMVSSMILMYGGLRT